MGIIRKLCDSLFDPSSGLCGDCGLVEADQISGNGDFDYEEFQCNDCAIIEKAERLQDTKHMIKQKAEKLAIAKKILGIS